MRTKDEHTDFCQGQKTYTPSFVSYETFVNTVDVSIECCSSILKALHNSFLPFPPSHEAYECEETPPFIQRLEVAVGDKIIFFGDLHGSIHAFIRGLDELMYKGVLDENLHIKQKNVRIIFLGDLVDYGIYGIDTFFTVLQIFLRNPGGVFICRGNHEMIGCMTNSFFNECKNRFRGQAYDLNFEDEELPKWWQSFSQKMATICSLFSVSLFIGISNHLDQGYIQCCHGGVEEAALGNVKKLLEERVNIEFLDPDTCCASFGTNFSWGDVAGITDLSNEQRYPRMLNNQEDVHSRCDSIDDIERWFGDLNIKALFRGHQDQFNSFKVTFPGVCDPIYPLLLYDNCIDKYERDKLVLYKNEIDKVFKNQKHLYEHGFTLSEYLNNFNTLPVFTFSNARVPNKQLRDEGFGMLTVAESWGDSRVQVYVKEYVQSSPSIRICSARPTGT